jgi:TetR/AcrR family transcriptional regulator, transcriptional repressor for nem operon
MDSELSDKAREIVACAKALLAVGGYHSFSYADISDAVHISKPSIHHHFPSKAELVETVVAVYREETRAGLAQLERHVSGPMEQLQGYTNFWATCVRNRETSFCVCAMLATEIPTLPSQVATEVRGHFADMSEWLASVLSRGAAEGVFVLQGSPQTEALALLASVHGAMLSARAHDNPDLFVEILRPVLRRLTPSA